MLRHQNERFNIAQCMRKRQFRRIPVSTSLLLVKRMHAYLRREDKSVTNFLKPPKCQPHCCVASMRFITLGGFLLFDDQNVRGLHIVLYGDPSNTTSWDGTEGSQVLELGALIVPWLPWLPCLGCILDDLIQVFVSRVSHSFTRVR